MRDLETSGADGLLAEVGLPVTVTAIASSPTNASVALTAPNGWTVEPATVDMVFADMSSLTQSTSFMVAAPFGSVGSAELTVTAVAGGETTRVTVPAMVLTRPTLAATDGQAGPGQTGSITTTFFNSGQVDENDVTVSVVASPELTVVATSPATFAGRASA